MFHSHLSLSNSPPAAQPIMEAAQLMFQWHCHLPLALERIDVQASLEVAFRCELSHGPLAQGSAIRAVTLPPGGMMQVLLRERHSRLILDSAGSLHQRCEAVAAEMTYLHRLRRALRALGLPQNDRLAWADDNVRVTGTPVSFPFLTPVLQDLIDRAEAASRMSEAAARTARSALPRDIGPAAPARTLHNLNPRRSLTLFFYQAEKLQLARVELHQIDRLVEAPSAALAAEVQAAIDRNLIDLKLIDQQGRVTAAARSSLGWQRTFQLPTPHLLVRACPIDIGFTDTASGAASLDLRSRPGCAA